MISIIICSRHKDISRELYQNINDTIGVDYEVIVIDNSKNEYSICSAYNEGVRRAKYPYLCFMHEDIRYRTSGWGTKVLNHLSDDRIGIIGNFGGHYIPNFFPVVYVDGPISGNFIQGQRVNGRYITHQVQYDNFSKGLPIETAVVDGMWLCVRKDLFGQIRWDEKTFAGFHCYDIDICMQSHAIGKQVRVVFDVLLEHQSPGNIDMKFYEQLRLWYDKWETSLPILKGIERNLIPQRLLSLEDYAIHKSMKKTEVEKMWQEIEYSKRYRFGCMIFKLVDVLRGRKYSK